MVVCSSTKCTNSSRIKNIRFFKFPSEPDRRKTWMQNAGLLERDPGQYAKLCEVHFDEQQFESHREDGWRKLKPNAIPTIFRDDIPPKESRRKRKALEAPNLVIRLEKKRRIKRKKKRGSKNEGSLEFKRARKSSDKASTRSAYDPGDGEPSRRRKGRPQKISIQEMDSSETEIDEVSETEAEQKKIIAVLRADREQLMRENTEFERHNKAMTVVIMELEKHNKAMSVRLQEVDKDNKVLMKRVEDLEKQNDDLKAKLNCCFSEEQFQRMEKLVGLGKIERYIPAVK